MGFERLNYWTLSVGFLVLLAASRAEGLDIEWVRMTGQWPVDNSPAIIDVSGDATPEILAVNRGGQVFAWRLDGSPLASGPDSVIMQLPEGHWTSAPVVVHTPQGARLILCSTEGTVACFDRSFSLQWQHALGAETTTRSATPAVFDSAENTRLCFGDHSGTATALDTNGTVVWKAALGAGPCRAPLKTVSSDDGSQEILVASGHTLFALGVRGNELWRRQLEGEILSRPEVFKGEGRRLIVCGAGSGSLYALTLEGEVVWQTPIGDEIDSCIAFLDRNGASPLVLCTGLCGNLHAIDANGKRVWTHYYKAKGRGVPLVFDLDDDGNKEILVGTFAQHLYVFDQKGEMIDDTRLVGTISPSPLPLFDPKLNRTDFFVTTASLQAYRLRVGTLKSPYGGAVMPQDVKLVPTREDAYRESRGVVVRNPNGACIGVDLALIDEDGQVHRTGCITSRSVFELPYPPVSCKDVCSAQATVRAPDRQVLQKLDWRLSASREPKTPPPPRDTLLAWSTPAYGRFDDKHVTPFEDEFEPGRQGELHIAPLYKKEVDQAAFVVASTYEDPIRVRIVLDPLQTDTGERFAGSVVLREVVSTRTENGERAADAIPTLNDARVVLLPSHYSAKIWVSADAQDAKMGRYRGRLHLLPLDGSIAPIELSMHIEVVDLEMPQEFPLTLCTWDYVPNQWYSTRLADVFRDMESHGVNVFPRSTGMPPAKADREGNLTMDFVPLDRQLDELAGRGQILLHVGVPQIDFESPPSDEIKSQAQLRYLHALRDHLTKRGLDYRDYAFYPVDEPGLDHNAAKGVETLIEAARVIRAADPKFRIYTDPVVTLAWSHYEQIEPLIDVWCPNMRLVNGLLARDPRIERIMKSGKPVWSYECVPLVKSLSPLRYNRANAWRAKYFGLDGIGFWTHSTTTQDPWMPSKEGTAEYALVYPGVGPIPSVRWEAVRDGLEDVAAMGLLEKEMADCRARGVRPALVTEAEKVLRTAQTDIMELSDLVFIENFYLKKSDRRIWHTWSDARIYEQHRRRIAELTLALRQE
jgi:outer membrane protein assembly factor BamB